MITLFCFCFFNKIILNDFLFLGWNKGGQNIVGLYWAIYVRKWKLLEIYFLLFFCGGRWCLIDVTFFVFFLHLGLIVYYSYVDFNLGKIVQNIKCTLT